MSEGTFFVRDFMKDRFVTLEADSTVAEALSRMEKEGVHELPVMAGSGLKGWVSYTTLLRRGGVPPATKISHVMEQPPRVQKDSNLVDAAELMIKNNTRALPVVNTKGQVVGILSRTDVLDAALKTPSIAGMPLQAVMNSELEACTEDEMVDKAVARLRQLHINQLLVLDGNGKLAGFVGLEDLLKAHVAEHSPRTTGRGRKNAGQDGASRPSRVDVKGFLKQPPTLGPNAKLREAIRAMQAENVNFVVVTQENRPLGVVSRSNIVERVVALKPTQGILCQIVGLSEHNGTDLEPIYSLAQHSLKKISSGIKPDFLTLHYKVYKAKEGGDSKYALSVHLGTEGRFWVQKADAWNPLDATRLALDNLERRVAEVKEMRLEKRKGSRRKANFYEAAPA